MRLLDQVIAFAGDSILFEDVTTVIGLIPYDVYFDFSTAIRNRDVQILLSLLQKIRSTGLPLEDVLQGLNQHFRNLMVATVERGTEILEVTTDLAVKYKEAASHWDGKDLLRIARILNDLEFSLKRAAQPGILFEMTAFKLLEMDRAVSIEKLLSGNLTGADKKLPFTDPTQEKQPEKEHLPKGDKIVGKKEPEDVSNRSKIDESIVSQSLSKSEPIPKPEISLEIINNGWASLVAKISEKRQSISMVLEHSVPIDLSGNRLLVHVFDLPKFSTSTLEKNRSVIEEFLEEQYGSTLRLRAEWKPGESPAISTGENLEMKQTQKKGDPVIDRIIEQFDGEILS